MSTSMPTSTPISTSGAEGTCTCGRCFDGWLSPRMKDLLDYSTELRYALAQSLLATQDGVGEDITRVLPIDYTHIDSAVYYLPPAVRHQIGPSSSFSPADPNAGTTAGTIADPAGDTVYRGYVAVFRTIKGMLSEARTDFPTTAAVSAALASLSLRAPSHTSPSPSPSAATPTSAPAHTTADTTAETTTETNKEAAYIAAFLASGGSAAHALDCIVDRAREELSPLGRLYDAETQYIDAVLDSAEGRAECANDLDFALVRRKLGLPVHTLASLPAPEGGEDARDPVSDDEGEGAGEGEGEGEDEGEEGASAR